METPNETDKPIPLSIVIRTFNSGGTLGAVLKRLDREAHDQLVVVDSGSTDSTLALAAQAGAEIVHLPAKEFTYGRSLNKGFEAARHEWVLVLSSHCIPMRGDMLGVYRRALRRFPDTVAAAVGPVLWSELDRKLARGITLYDDADLRYGFGFGAGNPNSLYRRDLWRRHSFDETLPAAEDLEWYAWAVRNGLVVAAVHEAEVRYASRRSWRVLYRKGRLDHRICSRFLAVERPSLGILVAHTAKLLLYGCMGRIDIGGLKGSFFHYLGAWVEAKKPRA